MIRKSVFILVLAMLFTTGFHICNASADERGNKRNEPNISIDENDAANIFTKLEESEELALQWEIKFQRAFEDWLKKEQESFIDEVWKLVTERKVEKPERGAFSSLKSFFNKIISGNSSKPMMKPPDGQDTLVIKNPTPELLEAAKGLSEANTAIDGLSLTLWKNVTMLTPQMRTRLMVDEIGKNMRRNLGPVITKVMGLNLPRNDECRQGLVGSGSLWRHMKNVATREADGALVGLGELAYQMSCISAGQMRMVEIGLYSEMVNVSSMYRKAVRLGEWQYDEALKDMFGSSANAMLLFYDGVKRTGWSAGQSFFCKFGNIIIDAYNKGALEEFGLWFYDYFKNELEYINISKTDLSKIRLTCSPVEAPIIKDGYTQLGADIAALGKKCDGGGVPTDALLDIGSIMGRITNVGLVGMAFMPFSNGVIFGTADTTSLCPKPSGGMGSGGSASGMNCSYSSVAGAGKASGGGGGYSCAVGGEGGEAPLSGYANAGTGGAPPGTITPADMFEFKNLKVGNFCMGLAGGDEYNDQNASSNNGLKTDEDLAKAVDTFIKSLKDAPPKSKEDAKKAWDEQKDGFYSAAEEVAQMSFSPETKAKMDAAVYNAIDKMQTADLGGLGISGMAGWSGTDSVIIDDNNIGPHTVMHELGHVALYNSGIPLFNISANAGKIVVEDKNLGMSIETSPHHGATGLAGLGYSVYTPKPYDDSYAMNNCSIYSMWANGVMSCSLRVRDCSKPSPGCGDPAPPNFADGSIGGWFAEGSGGGGAGGGPAGMPGTPEDGPPQCLGFADEPCVGSMSCHASGGSGNPFKMMECYQDDCYPTQQFKQSLITNPGYKDKMPKFITD